MSTRFENILTLPRPGMASLLLLSPEDLASVVRWHLKEWNAFLSEWRDHHKKLNTHQYDRIKYASERFRYGLPRKQRGTIQMAAFGVVAQGETVSLSGTSGSPNLSQDKENTPTNALAGWRFNTDGNVERVVSDVWQTFRGSTEWINYGPVGDYWLQATLNAGDAPNFSSAALNTWHVIHGTGQGQRTFQWLEDSDPGSFASTDGTLLIEISNDSSGTPVLASGYYRGRASQNGTL